MTVPLCPVDCAPGDQGQEERREVAVRAGGAAAPERDGEDVRDLEQQARERPVRVLRKRPEQLTAVVTNRTEAGVERVLQAEDVQMPMLGDLGLRKVFQSLELQSKSSRRKFVH